MEIADIMEETLVPIAFFAAVVLSLFFYFKTRNKERMAMIEKGFELKEKKSKPYQALRTGVFFIGVALGLFFGYLLKRYTTVEEEISYFSMILLFGGLSLVVNHYIILKLTKKEVNG
ncbi:MAG: hypothetical protein PVF73_11005 [Bacteroidales bacterium]|jgi:hypothetical protein